MLYPFPFFGSGDADYFEFAELSVVFETPPTPNQLEQITSTAPPPLVADDPPSLDGRVLSLSGGQVSHAWIAQHYAPDGDEAPDSAGRMLFAAPSQVSKFNADIERWLREIAPHGVRFALRAPDWEAGGTQYDAWHAHSMTSILDVIARLDREKSDAAWLRERLADFAREAGHVLPEDEDTFEARVQRALDGGDGAALVAAIESTDADGSCSYLSVKQRWNRDDPAHRDAALALPGAVAWLDFPNLVHVVVHAALQDAPGHDQILDLVAKQAKKKPFTATHLASMAQKLAESGHPQGAWMLLDRLVDIAKVHPMVLEIALYTLGQWVSGRMPPAERVARYVSKAKPRVGEHPRLLLYLACVAEEEGDRAEAEAHVRAALDAGLTESMIRAETPLIETLKRMLPVGP